MYSGEDEHLCVEVGLIGKDLNARKASQPDKSKAGGSPAWFGEAPVTDEELVCRLCGRKLFLVAQVYAPTQVLRSICIFGCNRADCATQPRAWRVIRTQQSQQTPAVWDSTSSSNTIPKAPTSTTTPAAGDAIANGGVPPAAPVAKNSTNDWQTDDTSWGDRNGEGDDWGKDGGNNGDWGDSTAAADGGDGVGILAEAVSGVPSIDTLLTQQENRSRQDMSDRAKDTKGDPLSKNAHGIDTPTRRQGGQSTPQNAGNGEREMQAEKGESITDRYKPTGSLTEPAAGGSKAHFGFPVMAINFSSEPWEADPSRGNDKGMEDRLRRYREQEEDRGLVAALDQALRVSSSSGSKPGATTSAAGVGEKYERTPARAKAVMRFAERVSRAPQQVVRYAYGGMPLWSASDPPKDDAPICTCGATRVFEMQLMPALLLRLRVNDYAASGDRQSDRSEQLQGQAEKSLHRGSSNRSADGPTIGNKTSTIKNVGVDQDNESSRCREDESLQCKNNNHQAVEDSRDSRQREALRVGDDGVGGVNIMDVKDDEGVEDVGSYIPPAASAQEMERLKTHGMDWGVVAVWCCPRSCELSFEEVAVVQAAV